MRPVKTIRVIDLIERANHRLKADIDQSVKANICIEIESILELTGNYKGFTYIGQLSKETEYNRRYCINKHLIQKGRVIRGIDKYYQGGSRQFVVDDSVS